MLVERSSGQYRLGPARPSAHVAGRRAKGPQSARLRRPSGRAAGSTAVTPSPPRDAASVPGGGGGGHRRGALVIRPHREDLVDAHAVLGEGEATADEVEAPDPGGGFAHQGDEVVPAVLQGAVPGRDGGDVVLAERLGRADFEPRRLQKGQGLSDGAHVHVGRDAGLDEGTSAGGRRAA